MPPCLVSLLISVWGFGVVVFYLFWLCDNVFYNSDEPHTPYVAKDGLEHVYVCVHTCMCVWGARLPMHARVEASSQHQGSFSIDFYLSFLRVFP